MDIQEIETKIEKMFKEKEKYIMKYNKNKEESDLVTEGSLVLVKNRDKKNKFDLKWIGPFYVGNNKGHGTYEVRSMENGKIYKIHRRDLVEFNEKENFISILEENDLTEEGRVLQPESIKIGFSD